MRGVGAGAGAAALEPAEPPADAGPGAPGLFAAPAEFAGAILGTPAGFADAAFGLPAAVELESATGEADVKAIALFGEAAG